MGERSMVPPMGGMMPRKRLRYGSVMDPSGPMIWAGGLGNHVNTRRAMIAVLYRLLQGHRTDQRQGLGLRYG